MLKTINALALLFTLCACDTVDDTLGEADRILDGALSRLENQSDAWRGSLEETRDVLIKQGQTTLANEVSNLIGTAGITATNTGQCSADFLRDRARDAILRAKAAILPKKYPVPPLVPQLCLPVPSTINMALPPDQRPVVNISGFNLSSTAEGGRPNVKMVLQQAGGATTDVSAHLSVASPYLLTINLGATGVPLDYRSEKLVIRDQKDKGLSELGIIQPIASKIEHVECNVTTTLVDNNDYTVCPAGAAVVGLAGGMGHSQDFNEGHAFRCCKLGPVQITESCIEHTTAVDNDTLTTQGGNYVVTGLAGGWGHSADHNVGHGVRFCKLNEALFRVGPTCAHLATGVDSPAMNICPQGYAVTGIVGGYGHSGSHNTPHHLQCCEVLADN